VTKLFIQVTKTGKHLYCSPALPKPAEVQMRPKYAANLRNLNQPARVSTLYRSTSAYFSRAQKCKLLKTFRARAAACMMIRRKNEMTDPP